MAIRNMTPTDFNLLRDRLPHNLRDVCDLAEGITEELRYVRDHIRRGDDGSALVVEIDPTKIESLIAGVGTLQAMQIKIINETEAGISKEVKDEIREDLKNYFIISTSKTKQTHDALRDFYKKLNEKDYSQIILLAANIETYLGGYIYSPLLETAKKIETEANQLFAIYSANRHGLIPKYELKAGLSGIRTISKND